MDFDGVVRKIRCLHEQCGSGVQQTECGIPDDRDIIYGRVCTSLDENPPEWLSNPERRTVFVFGPDAVQSVLLEVPVPELLYKLGSDRQYLYHKVVELKQMFWLVLFTVSPASSIDRRVYVVPATWDGVFQHVGRYYPNAKEDVLTHMETLQHRSFEDFERDAGFHFFDSKKNKSKPDAYPPYFGYEYFVQLPKPRTAWQVRAFLFCELRLLKLYSGDGYTVVEKTKERGVLEYLCPNVSIKRLVDATKCAILPLNVTVDTINKP